MKIAYNSKLKKYARELRNNMTHAEKATWRMLRGRQMQGFDFHRQKPIGYFIADFYCHDLKLVIEVDGISHEEEEVKDNDLRKDMYYRGLGLNILRFTDDEVLGNWNSVEKIIKEYISSYTQDKETHPIPPLNRGGIRQEIVP